MFKPTRGMSKPTLRGSSGINQFALIKLLEACEAELRTKGEENSAFRFEMLKTFFKEDYEEGKPLKYSGQMLGF
jgi:hypothetical protein